MMMHPGKKLNFMGNEIAMFREWDETKELDYFLLKYPNHDSFQKYFAELGRIYCEYPALYEMDYDPKGFRWVTINDNGRNLFGIERYDKTQKKNVIAIFNFSNTKQTYWLHPEKSGALVPILNTDWERFGGQTKELPPEAALLRADSVSGVEIELAPFGSILYEVK
jgi:1,4-alpha-glucan branching enzyme